MKWTRMIMVMLVVVILVLAYFAFVGESKPNKDVNTPKDDPTGGDRLPTAYGIINCEIGINNGLSRYYGKVESFGVSVYDFISFSEGQTYRTEKWDILGWWSDDIKCWVEVKIAGPGQFSLTWKSDTLTKSVDEWGWEYVEFQSGRMFFWDKGTYTATLTAYADGPEYKGVIASGTTIFDVAV